MRGCAASLGWVLACVFLTTARAEESGPAASGSLAWISSDKLDLVGTVNAELPLANAGPWRIFASLGAVTAIEKSTSNFTFLVDRVSYAARFGARRGLVGHGEVEVFAGESGMMAVDAPGRARVRVVGAAWETSGFHDGFGPIGWSGRASLAAVVEHHGVDASAEAAGGVRYLGRVSKGGRVFAGVDADFEALLGSDGGTDLTIGPRVDFDLGGDRRFGLFVRWLHGGNPLGLATDGVLGGFEFAEGLHPTGPREIPPEIAGSCSAGGGDGGRGVVRLDIRVASPPFWGGTYGEIEVDGNVLTAADVDDLFYLYDVGVAHPFSSWRAGLWFHHRSNHVLADANPTVTSINVLETGVESAGWNRSEPGVLLGRAGAIDVQLRAGWLIDSSFGEDASWHAYGGVRWASPELGPARIYLSAAAERGDVGGSAYAVGVLLPRGWDVRVEVRHDEQIFSADQRATLGIGTLRY